MPKTLVKEEHVKDMKPTCAICGLRIKLCFNHAQDAGLGRWEHMLTPAGDDAHADHDARRKW